jgi:DNA-binding NtrC family response regulator
MSYALLIDDEPGVRQSYTSLAEAEELTLLTASTWDEGLALFQTHSPVLVIVDYNLPGSRHGLQLLAEMRHHSPSVRLVLLSGYIDSADARAVEATGLVDRALPKTDPDSIDTLVEEIVAAKTRAAEGTNWPAYARAHLSAKQVSQQAVDELDARIQAARGFGTPK